MFHHKKTENERPPQDLAGKHPLMHASEAGAVAGEVAGAILGSAAGPPGTVAGMVIGGLAGALVGHVVEREDQRASAHDAELDRDIGVSGGDIGRPSRRPPPPKR